MSLCIERERDSLFPPDMKSEDLQRSSIHKHSINVQNIIDTYNYICVIHIYKYGQNELKSQADSIIAKYTVSVALVNTQTMQMLSLFCVSSQYQYFD